jgi:hypothetical protein
MKFKVGDKVRVRKDLVDEQKYGGQCFVYDMSKFMDKIATIKSVYNSCYCIEEDGGEWFWTDEMFESNVINCFTKADLKDGMVVEYRDGDRRMVMGNKFISDFGFAFLHNFTNTLEGKCFDSMTIDKIYKSSSHTLDGYFKNYNLTLIWKRPTEEPIKEMTVAEIEKELGYKVKIKSED